MKPALASKEAASTLAGSARKMPVGKEKLFRAAERLFAEHGYEAVSTKQLAQVAGVTIGALYHHFPSKEEAYRATVLNALAKLPHAPEAALQDHKDAREQLCMLVAWYSSTIGAPTDEATLLRRELLDPHLGILLTDIEVFAQPYVQFRKLLDLLAPEVNPELILAMIVSLSFGLIGLKGVHPNLPSLAPLLADYQALARQITDMVLRGI